jgi:hypothetical protein
MARPTYSASRCRRNSGSCFEAGSASRCMALDVLGAAIEPQGEVATKLAQDDSLLKPQERTT